MSDVETTIVGAGPYGLSIAAHFLEAGLPFRIFGTPLETWRSYMPPGMLLKSDRWASSLWDPGRRYTIQRWAAEKGVPYVPYGPVLSLAEFLEYGDWFQRRVVRDVVDVKVDRIDRNGAGYELSLADGSRLTSRQVILATGYMNFQHVPAELASVPEPLRLHTAQLHDLTRFAGRDVTIVGAGQSALETAALMREAGAHPRLIVRREHVKWNPPTQRCDRPMLEKLRDPKAGLGSGWKEVAIGELPRVFRAAFPPEKRHRFVASSWGPTGAHWLRPRLEGVELAAGHRVRAASVQGERVRLEVEGPGGTREIVTDHLIAGTGFKVDLDRMSVLAPALRASLRREGPAPLLDASCETSSRGLFIVGVASAPTFGPVMRFMFGAKHAAVYVTRRLKWRRRLKLG